MRRKYLIVFAALILLIMLGVYIVLNESIIKSWTTKRVFTEKLSNKSKMVRIEIGKEAQYPDGIRLLVEGKLNGRGIIGYGWTDSTMYMHDTVENEFDINFRTDWYSDVCFIMYQPLTATDGIMDVDCEIYSSEK